MKNQHKGYYKRTGYIPHFDQPGVVQSITFRLADSLPTHVLEQMQADPKYMEHTEKRKQIERYLDAGYGECHLKNPQIAELVQEILFFFDQEERTGTSEDRDERTGTSVDRDERYRLIAWVIMPNHVHVLVELIEGYPMGKIVQAWKSYSAREANAILGRKGQFWAPDYFDRYSRNQEHFNNVIRYIHHNPVQAGLVKNEEDWPYSSASLGEGNIRKSR